MREDTSTRARDPIAVWLVEDQDLYRRTLAELIESAPDLHCGMAAGSCEALLEALEAADPPQIVLMDLGLPGMDGVEGIAHVRRLSPATRVIVLTVHEEDEKVFAAICAGASGYLLKTATAEAVLDAIRDVESGAAPINAYIARKVLDRFAEMAGPRHSTPDYGLTTREREVLQLMVDGLITKQIAARLEVSYHTIDTHIRNIYDKLHVHSRSGAVAKALREGLV